ncbi:MAG TPA: TetR family transcriptional regulator [Fimbriimonas sp.]
MAIAETKPETRDLILDACDRIMARYGFRKMTMDDLAQEAGVSKRTIYVYFRSKEEVGLSSIGRVVQRAAEEMARIGEENADPLDRLRRMLEARVMARVDAVQDYHHSLDELFEVVRPAYMARRKETFKAESALVARILAEAGCPPESADALLLATNAFLPYSLSVRELGRPEEIRRRLLAMIDLLIYGVHQR